MAPCKGVSRFDHRKELTSPSVFGEVTAEVSRKGPVRHDRTGLASSGGGQERGQSGCPVLRTPTQPPQDSRHDARPRPPDLLYAMETRRV